jgi:hypothetical protein
MQNEIFVGMNTNTPVLRNGTPEKKLPTPPSHRLEQVLLLITHSKMCDIHFALCFILAAKSVQKTVNSNQSRERDEKIIND